MTGPDKVLEDRLRRTLKRRGYTLSRSARRDPLATDYGKYMIGNAETGEIVLKLGDKFTTMQREEGDDPLFNMSLTDVQRWVDAP